MYLGMFLLRLGFQQNYVTIVTIYLHTYIYCCYSKYYKIYRRLKWYIDDQNPAMGFTRKLVLNGSRL